MKKAVAITSGLILLAAATSAQALDGSVTVGKKYTNLNVGMGTRTPGLFLNGNWMRSNDDGSLYGLGLGYNLSVAGLMLSPGVRTLYVKPHYGKSGYTNAVGLGASYPVTSMLGLYGSYYWAPASFSHNIDAYKDIQAGVTLSPIRMLTVNVGYQYLTLDGKDNNKDSVLADGPYIGASLNF
ncbi:porin [Erwinia sp. OLTSP20]|uniref:YfaZ family outer membrane protein n=1 Tax=unclassified Erwinia TaxID=2622719 RepID=UPI000C199ED4|nr:MULTISPECIES: YfaZ family outer membrane protein [unclassified Erwinia]PIJ50378.1 porin [Erwinia sp. OAMSP11]PIJ71637.1 porin [Erwinia sp. OLSSP12]PIJ81021.1 porin [Erwinia sp. OLCASP19]PIJ83279.1 porin [Erwinia sp. OLMTSP26]PIJ85959.1 porin [Erwinia sp. OLMDSP33]